MPLETLKDPDLEELTLLYGLSVRAVHVCERAELDRLSLIHAFHKQQGGFGKLANCGPKTVLELETLVADTDRPTDPASDAPAKRIPEELAQQIYQRHVQGLSAQARHVLRSVIGGADGHCGVEFFLRYGERPPQLAGRRGPGRRELLRMCTALFNDLEHARQTVGQLVDGAHGNALHRWALRHSVSSAQMKELFGEAGSMTLLRFLSHYLRAQDRRTPHRIVMAYLESPGHYAAMVDIAERFGVTREYTRHVLADIHKRSNRLFRLASDLPDVHRHYPELLTSAPVFLIDADVLARLNAKEKTRWSRLGALYIMQAVSRHDQVVGSWSTWFGKTHRAKELDVQHPFLIARNVIAPISRLLHAFAQQFEMERRVPEELHLQGLLELEDPSMHLPLLEALKVLFGACYPGIRITGDGCILPANKSQFNEHRLKEVLEKLDVPSHVGVIREVWNNSYPDHPISVGGIRTLAADHKDKFMSMGRTSMYGLTRWLEERPGLKAGTVRSILAELLGEADIPLHLEELETAVKCFRPDANLKSILQNLKLAREFKLYPGGHVGLADKVYARIPEPAISVPGGLMRVVVLTRFIDLPRSELSAFLASRCQASPSQIERVIENAVAKRRLVIDEAGIIRGIRPPAGDQKPKSVVVPMGLDKPAGGRKAS